MLIVWRLLDEGKFLLKNLQGYAEYCEKVRSRLLPFPVVNELGEPWLYPSASLLVSSWRSHKIFAIHYFENKYNTIKCKIVRRVICVARLVGER